MNALREKGRRVDVSVYPDNAHSLGMPAYAEKIHYLREHLLGLAEPIASDSPVTEGESEAADAVDPIVH